MTGVRVQSVLHLGGNAAAEISNPCRACDSSDDSGAAGGEIFNCG
jgi:hypothetical protein